MKAQNIVALDIGTTKIACLIAQINAQKEIEIIGIGISHSMGGIKKGMVINLDKTGQAIREAVDEAEHMAGVKVEGVFVGVAGEHIKSENSRGVIAISRPEKEITQEDVDRVIEQAKAISLPIDRRIIHVIPQSFTVDNQDGIRDPVGMAGHKLEVDVHIITGAIASIQNIHKSVERAGIFVKDIVLQPMASSDAVLRQEEKDLGVVVIDIGGGTTDVCLYYDGSIRDTFVIGLGGENITNDIAVGMRIPRNSAEDVKIKYGCTRDFVDSREIIEVPSIGGTGKKEISRELLAEIIEPRLEEIFTLVWRRIKNTGISDLISAGVVLTGGTAKMKGIEELGEQIFGCPVRVGTVGGISEIFDTVRDPIHSTGVGLILYGMRHIGEAELTSVPSGSVFSRLTESIRKWFTE